MLGKASKHNGEREVQRRCPPPTKRRRQVAPGPPVKPHSHFRTAGAARRAVRLASAAAPHKPTPGHHTGPRTGSQLRVGTMHSRRGSCLDTVAIRRLHASTRESPSSPPQTPEPPARQTASEKKRPAACGAAEMCWGEASGKLKAQGANVATPDRRSRTAPAIRKATRRANDSMLKNQVGTTTWTSIRALRLRPPNRLPTQPPQQRSGQRHAVLRRCAEAKQAASPMRRRERYNDGPPAQDGTSHPDGNPTGKRRHTQETPPGHHADTRDSPSAPPQTTEPPACPTASSKKRPVACGAAEAC